MFRVISKSANILSGAPGASLATIGSSMTSRLGDASRSLFRSRVTSVSVKNHVQLLSGRSVMAFCSSSSNQSSSSESTNGNVTGVVNDGVCTPCSAGNGGCVTVIHAESTDPFVNISTEHVFFNDGIPSNLRCDNASSNKFLSRIYSPSKKTNANASNASSSSSSSSSSSEEDVVVSKKTHDPNVNPSLFLWRNDPVVILGRHQNPWREVDVDKVLNKGVHIVRRFSGGGTVYQDLGNLCYTFLLPRDLFDRERNAGIIVRALKQLGFEGAQTRGRNDIVIDHNGELLKVSGAAYRIKGDRAIHHGTMLVSVDLPALGSLLTPSAKKLASKGIESVRSRVTNLTAINPEVTISDVSRAIMEEFAAEYGDIVTDALFAEPDARTDQRIASQAGELKEWTWMYGTTPAFTLRAEERFAWGTFDVNIDVEKGIVREAILFSDCLVPEFVDAAQQAFVGRKFTPEDIRVALEEADLSKTGIAIEQVNQFISWICKEIS